MKRNTNGKGQETDMTSEKRSRFGRRDFLRRGALFGAAAGTGTVAGGALVANAVSSAPGGGLAQLEPLSGAIDYTTIAGVRIMATDGHFSYPGRRHAGPDQPPIFGFGFRAVDDLRLVGSPALPGNGTTGELNANVGDLISKYKGKVLQTSPTIAAIEGEDLAIVLTNLGLIVRPDLDDAHSLHWHGFRNATAVFDGVPETSISVPSGRDLPYFFDPKLATQKGQNKGSAGTYMYHCHFEDTEHVQMGMIGVIFIEPRDMWFEPNGTTPKPRDKIAYNRHSVVNDGAPTLLPGPMQAKLEFDREFALCAAEIDTAPHDNLEAVQEFVWSDYKPNYWTINGRSYPDTVIPQITPRETVEIAVAANNDADPLNDHWPYAEPVDMLGDAAAFASDEEKEWEMKWQHNSSLVQCMEGERVLLRLVNLGFEIHSLELVGAEMEVIAHDASLLVGADGQSDLTYKTRRIEIGPGEARDVMVTAPDFDINAIENDPFGGRAGVNPDGTPRTQANFRVFNRYILKSRNNHRNTNNGATSTDAVDYAGVADTYGGMVTELWVYPDPTRPRYQPGGTHESAAAAASPALPEQMTANETYPTLVVPAGHV